VVEVTSALNDKSEPGPCWLSVVKGALALNDKSELGPRQLPVVEAHWRSTTSAF